MQCDPDVHKCTRLAAPSRWGVLGLTTIAFLGLTKLNITGPGITATVKQLWTKPKKA